QPHMPCHATPLTSPPLSPTFLTLYSSPPSFSLTQTSPPELYTLSLHDALPISAPRSAPCRRTRSHDRRRRTSATRILPQIDGNLDRKSTRLNSSHQIISYAVFCLKKKRKRS